ncbi:MAG: hypothetical protein C0619_09480 [Desulfuromonas sp.]|nr:MAG: hypothetical protein C0619_09480 [Desulfuromonas sp.]
MKYLMLIIVGLMLTGCASMQESYTLDQEFGRASGQSWQQQIAFPDAGMVPVVPTGIDGITAEEIMGVYNGTFAEEPMQQNVLSFGLPGGK